MVLLGMLSLVGFLFYTFAASERSNATYFSEAHKSYTSELDADALFDWSLQQLIVGPDNSLTHSALYGKRKSLIPTALGWDIHPYNSGGVHLGSNAGLPFTDLNHDGTSDGLSGVSDPLEFNDSQAAWGSSSPRDVSTMPDPGVDYTYPDINNPFLAYKGYAIDPDGNTVQVIIPSFHRPQLLRTAGGSPSASWWSDPLFAKRILRPHPDHLNPDGSNRFPTAVTGTLTTTFPFMPGTAGEQGVWSLSSAYVNGTTTLPAYEWDVDNDGDLIKEGVWLDLHYPIQTDASGRKFVAMFSYTVYDADALFNLNVHGNHSYLTQLNRLGDFYQDDTLPTALPINASSSPRFLSGSNQGVTPSEVNPQYALNSLPDTTANGGDYSGTNLPQALQSYAYQFGNAPVGATQNDMYVMSNMDWYRLMTGTANFQSATTFNDVYAGRYGEASSVLVSALNQGATAGGSFSSTPPTYMPFPGATGVDDNWNRYESQFAWDLQSGMPGVSSAGGQLLQYNPGTPQFFPTQLTYYAAWPYGQPMDFDGNGSVAMPGTAGKTRRTTVASGGRMPFPVYMNYDNPYGRSSYSQAGSSDLTNLLTVAAGWRPDSLLGQQMVDILGNSYFTGPNQPAPSIATSQMDEVAEMVVEPAKVSSSDSILGADEAAGLHLEATDRTNTGISSRARLLMSFNLQDSQRADQIAKRFTPASWDRKNFGYAGTGYHRLWETTSNTFPPIFPVGTYTTTDPFRPPVRKLLELTAGSQVPNNEFQFRLSFNHLTTTDSTGNNLIQRAITPHDPNLNAAQASSTQETLARRDRQQMARDIYVLLYTLGGGLDGTGSNAQSSIGHTGPIGAPGYTGDNSAFNLYNARQLREMAQFAVNIVDATDSDHVMTKFEYDKNLGNGWNLDDNPYDYTQDNAGAGFTPYATNDTNYNSAYPEDCDERGAVYGVETQEITLSEALVIRSDKVMMDQSPTEYNDSIGHRYFTYVELRNISPSIITMNGQYRVRVVPKYSPASGSPVTGMERRVALLQGTIDPDSFKLIGNAGQTDAAKPVAPNHSRFQAPIGYTSGTPMFNQAYAQIVPPSSGIQLDYELLNDTERASGKYRITKVDSSGNETDITTGANETPGGFLNETTASDNSGSVIPANLFSATFYLDRRQYPDRPAPNFNAPAVDQADNPWVQVDSFQLKEFKEFALAMGDTGSAINGKLKTLASRERRQPLDRSALADATDTNPAVTGMDGMSYTDCRPNTIGRENAGSLNPFTYWQLTYDRPLASPMEALHLPLYGPNSVTLWAAQSLNSPYQQTTDMQTDYAAQSANGPGAQNAIPYAATAAGKVLQPEDVNNLAAAVGSKYPVNDNRWYRLFEFMEVPTRMHRQLGNPLLQVRTPGKMNLNMIRHTDVHAGLLDDTDVMTFAGMQTTKPILQANDPMDMDSDPNLAAPIRRDWWMQFLKARDGRLVLSGGNMTRQADNVTNLFLPGLADSTPFRSLGSVGFVQTAARQSPQDALENTIFRKLPTDLNTPALDSRHLWEVGRYADHAGGGGGTPLQSEMRHRLLSKIFNNTTTRSHVFLVFVSVQPFEADDTNGAQNVRIGGVLRDTNGNPQFNYRGFFLIDRSQPEDAYVYDSSTMTGSFPNWQALVKYRLRLD